MLMKIYLLFEIISPCIIIDLPFEWRVNVVGAGNIFLKGLKHNTNTTALRTKQNWEKVN